LKAFLFPLLTSLVLPSAIKAGFNYEIDRKCIEANDYFGYVKSQIYMNPKKFLFIPISLKNLIYFKINS
tara:strand:+ start:1029 stop:1235 length:207 start_codon:yes stop_codon:yes gene_type:complete